MCLDLKIDSPMVMVLAGWHMANTCQVSGVCMVPAVVESQHGNRGLPDSECSPSSPGRHQSCNQNHLDVTECLCWPDPKHSNVPVSMIRHATELQIRNVVFEIHHTAASVNHTSVYDRRKTVSYQSLVFCHSVTKLHPLGHQRWY